MKKHILIIAGSDPSGGAGVQADLTTAKDFGVPSLSCISALTAQNDRKVLQIHPTAADLLTQQLSVATEGKEIAAVKIGMVANLSNVSALVFFLHSRNFPQVVIDPILHSSSGTPLLEKRAYTHFRQKLLPIATVITPNLPEASVLIGSRIYNEETQIAAAKQLYDEIKSLRAGRYPGRDFAIIIKGGHREDEAVDILYDGTGIVPFRSRKIEGPPPRGDRLPFLIGHCRRLGQRELFERSRSTGERIFNTVYLCSLVLLPKPQYAILIGNAKSL